MAPVARRSQSPGAPRIAPTDGELLGLFRQQGDRDALDRVIERHGPMVWAVCRGQLRRAEDAEDAFQATFLLLIKHASSIRSSESAAGWLYRVAYRTSIRARKQIAKRREEALALDPDAPGEEAFPDLLKKQTNGVLVEELMRLPAKYQAPLVLRYLEGQSRRAIADQTDSTVATVQGRLARGKAMLRRRLLRRGVSLSAAMAALGLSSREAQAAVPTHVVAQTASNGVALATGGSIAASAAVTLLYRQGVNAMLFASFGKPAAVVTAATLVALLCFAPGGGAAAIARSAEPAIDATLPRDESGGEEAAAILVAQADSAANQPLPPPAGALAKRSIIYSRFYSASDLLTSDTAAGRESQLNALVEGFRAQLPPGYEVRPSLEKESLVATLTPADHEALVEYLNKRRQVGKTQALSEAGAGDAPANLVQATPTEPARQESSPAGGERSDVVDPLEELVGALEDALARVEKLRDEGEIGGADVNVTLARHALADARAQLALARGDRDQARKHYAEAITHADQAVDAEVAAYQAGRRTLSDTLEAYRLRAEAKVALARLAAGEGDSPVGGAAQAASPASPEPANGSVYEYWPDGSTKARRKYLNGQLAMAYEYAQDGTVLKKYKDDVARPADEVAGPEASVAASPPQSPADEEERLERLVALRAQALSIKEHLEQLGLPEDSKEHGEFERLQDEIRKAIESLTPLAERRVAEDLREVEAELALLKGQSSAGGETELDVQQEVAAEPQPEERADADLYELEQGLRDAVAAHSKANELDRRIRELFVRNRSDVLNSLFQDSTVPSWAELQSHAAPQPLERALWLQGQRLLKESNNRFAEIKQRTDELVAGVDANEISLKRVERLSALAMRAQELHQPGWEEREMQADFSERWSELYRRHVASKVSGVLDSRSFRNSLEGVAEGLRRFQQKNSLEPTGELNEATWNKLFGLEEPGHEAGAPASPSESASTPKDSASEITTLLAREGMDALLAEAGIVDDPKEIERLRTQNVAGYLQQSLVHKERRDALAEELKNFQGDTRQLTQKARELAIADERLRMAEALVEQEKNRIVAKEELDKITNPIMNRAYGHAVEILQRALNERLEGVDLSVDNNYGPPTAEAVARFQREAKLPATGFADAATREKLGLTDPPVEPLLHNNEHPSESYPSLFGLISRVHRLRHDLEWDLRKEVQGQWGQQSDEATRLKQYQLARVQAEFKGINEALASLGFDEPIEFFVTDWEKDPAVTLIQGEPPAVSEGGSVTPPTSVEGSPPIQGSPPGVVHLVADIIQERGYEKPDLDPTMLLLDLAGEVQKATGAKAEPLGQPENALFVRGGDAERQQAARDYLRMLRDRSLDGRLSSWPSEGGTQAATTVSPMVERAISMTEANPSGLDAMSKFEREKPIRENILSQLSFVPGVRVLVQVSSQEDEVEAFASIGVPLPYVEAVCRQENPGDEEIDPAKLAAIRTRLKDDIEEIVEPLLPRLSRREADFRQASVAFFQDVPERPDWDVSQAKEPAAASSDPVASPPSREQLLDHYRPLAESLREALSDIEGLKAWAAVSKKRPSEVELSLAVSSELAERAFREQNPGVTPRSEHRLGAQQVVREEILGRVAPLVEQFPKLGEEQRIAKVFFFAKNGPVPFNPGVTMHSEPVAKRPAGRVDHTDGKADGKKSLGGSGHLIRFELPEGAAGVKSLRLHGSRYGTKQAPREDFEISFLSEDRSEILAVRRGAYGLFRRGDENAKWTNVRFGEPVVDLPETFWVAIDFNPGRTKGIYLSYDTSTGGERSMTGLAQDEPAAHKPVTFGGDWMVQLILERGHSTNTAHSAPTASPSAPWEPYPGYRDRLIASFVENADGPKLRPADAALVVDHILQRWQADGSLDRLALGEMDMRVYKLIGEITASQDSRFFTRIERSLRDNSESVTSSQALAPGRVRVEQVRSESTAAAGDGGVSASEAQAQQSVDAQRLVKGDILRLEIKQTAYESRGDGGKSTSVRQDFVEEVAYVVGYASALDFNVPVRIEGLTLAEAREKLMAANPRIESVALLNQSLRVDDPRLGDAGASRSERPQVEGTAAAAREASAVPSDQQTLQPGDTIWFQVYTAIGDMAAVADYRAEIDRDGRVKTPIGPPAQVGGMTTEAVSQLLQARYEQYRAKEPSAAYQPEPRYTCRRLAADREYFDPVSDDAFGVAVAPLDSEPLAVGDRVAIRVLDSSLRVVSDQAGLFASTTVLKIDDQGRLTGALDQPITAAGVRIETLEAILRDDSRAKNRGDRIVVRRLAASEENPAPEPISELETETRSDLAKVKALVKKIGLGRSFSDEEYDRLVEAWNDPTIAELPEHPRLSAAIKRSLRTAPEDLEELNALAWKHFFAREEGEAEELFRKILRVDEDHLAAINGLAFCALNQGRAAEAKPLFEKFLAAEPDAAGPLNGLARCLKAEGDVDGAIALWERSAATSPGVVSDPVYSLARVYAEREEWGKARPHLEVIVAENPGRDPYAEWLRSARAVAEADHPLTSEGVYVVGAYGQKLKGTPLTVVVPATEEPITLVCCSYFEQDWRLELAEGAKLGRVIVGGYFQQEIGALADALPKGVPLDVYTYFPTEGAEDGGPWPARPKERPYFWAYKRGDEYYDELVAKVRELTGKEIAGFRGGYMPTRIVVGP